MFRIKVVEKIKTRIFMFSDFFSENCDNVEKYGGAREYADNLASARGILDK
jgi:hypothetical protein